MDHSNARDEMDNVAALAESIQPKGNTLLTTSVCVIEIFLYFRCGYINYSAFHPRLCNNILHMTIYEG